LVQNLFYIYFFISVNLLLLTLFLPHFDKKNQYVSIIFKYLI